MIATDEHHVHDSNCTQNIIKSNKIIGKLFDNGTYDGNDIFRYLSTDDGILPCVKVRKNAKVRLKKTHFKKLSGICQ